ANQSTVDDVSGLQLSHCPVVFISSKKINFNNGGLFVDSRSRHLARWVQFTFHFSYQRKIGGPFLERFVFRMTRSNPGEFRVCFLTDRLLQEHGAFYWGLNP